MLCRPRHNIHLIRNTFRLASRKDWDALKHDVKPIYTAVNAEAARSALEELTEKWGPKYGAIIRLWNNAWEEFIPFLDYDVEIRTVLCSTNAIVSLESPRGCWWPSRSQHSQCSRCPRASSPGQVELLAQHRAKKLSYNNSPRRSWHTWIQAEWLWQDLFRGHWLRALVHIRAAASLGDRAVRGRIHRSFRRRASNAPSAARSTLPETVSGTWSVTNTMLGSM